MWLYLNSWVFSYDIYNEDPTFSLSLSLARSHIPIFFVNMQKIAGLLQTKSGISFAEEGENIGIA